MGRKKTKITQITPFGQKLALLRQKKGLSKESLSQSAGVSTTYISLLESGERNPSRNVVHKLVMTFYPEGNSLALDELLQLAGYAALHAASPVIQHDLAAIYEQAVAEDSQNFQAFSALILSLLKQGQYEQAQTRLQKGFLIFNEKVQLQSLLAMLELSKGRTLEAIATQEQAIAQFSTSLETTPETALQQANLLLNLGSMYFLHACELQSEACTEPQSHKVLEAFAQARETLHKASEMAPDDAYIVDEYARVCFNFANAQHPSDPASWQETIHAFRWILGLETKLQLGLPTLKEASLFLALAYAKIGEFDQAELGLQLLSSFCPQDWLLHYIQACCLCLKYTQSALPQPDWLHRALRHLRLASEDPDPHNRTRTEASQDADLNILSRLHPQAFADFLAE